MFRDYILYVLGDFSDYGKNEKDAEILKRLNGRKILVMGNHDRDHETEINNIVSTIKNRHIDVVSRATFEYNKKKY